MNARHESSALHQRDACTQFAFYQSWCSRIVRRVHCLLCVLLICSAARSAQYYVRQIVRRWSTQRPLILCNLTLSPRLSYFTLCMLPRRAQNDTHTQGPSRCVLLMNLQEKPTRDPGCRGGGGFASHFAANQPLMEADGLRLPRYAACTTPLMSNKPNLSRAAALKFWWCAERTEAPVRLQNGNRADVNNLVCCKYLMSTDIEFPVVTLNFGH
jgi:hypothetical protein